jgi:formylglycine-generating enzyme required for sulfatase activity/tRNA A-37 threonylcarbamoyl transferase component Bud32
MSDDRWSRVLDVCREALGREPAERASYLDEACAGDVSLRCDVEALLSHEAQAEGFLSTPPWTSTPESGGAPDTPGELRSVAGRTDPVPTLTPGARITHYEVLQFVGAGGMGEVYRARDTRLDRVVALKRLPPALAADPGRVARFSREARTLAQLNHPNICTLHDVVVEQGATLLVMEYLEGQTLADWIAQGPRPLPGILDVAAQIADGLAAAHTRGIVHRDLKPGNIMLATSGAARPGVLTVKLLDFGLAKLRLPEADALATVSETQAVDGHSTPGAVVGTVPYMSPEQIEGREVDGRTDLFSLGCVLYEMLTGHRAFTGQSNAGVISAVMTSAPPPIGEARPSTPPALQHLVEKCLAKNRDERWQTARDVADQLRFIAAPAAPPDVAREPVAGSGVTPGADQAARADEPRPTLARRAVRTARVHPWVAAAALLALAATLATLPASVARQRRLAWVRNEALPELLRLVDGRESWPAFLLARQIEAVVPGEPTVKNLRPRFMGETTREFRPVGARLLARPGPGKDPGWVELGSVGGKAIRGPLGPAVFRLEAPGYEPREFAMRMWAWPFDTKSIQGVISLARPGEAPPGMVLIETPATGERFGLESDGSFDLPSEGRIGSFFVDTREVTNREFKRFVDAGGYGRREYWTEPFERDGISLSWNEAMASFRDLTGRPGPATWQVGAYEPGTDELPVTGVSWYEASAYATFAGKRLPSIYHHAVASARRVATDVLAGSNFSGKLAPAGSYRGSLNLWGLYDTAGNAREWCSNLAGRERFALGGAADGPAYMFWNVEANTRSPFDRNAMNGFRCIKTVASNPHDARLDGPQMRKPVTDWTKVKGFSDDAWKTWQGLLSYQKSPLDAKTEWIDDSVPGRRIEKVTFDAAYAGERMIVYLFFPDPRRFPPPWQPIVFIHPGFGGAISSSQDGHNTMDLNFWEYLVKDGRVVVYPIVKGIFERGGDPTTTGNFSWSTWQPRVKDVFRTIDYLQTRTTDIRADHLGLLAASGGCDGAIIVCAVEPRVKATVIVGGGMYGVPAVDREMMGFASRISSPVQMVSGRSDMWGQEVLLRSFATPPDHKRFLQFDGDHSLAGFEKDVIRVNLEWFDKFLGPVR